MRAISTSIADARSDAPRQRLPQLDLGRAETAQLLAELAGARAARVDLRAQRRLEPCGGDSRDAGASRRAAPTPARTRASSMRPRTAATGADGGVDARGFRRAGALACCDGLVAAASAAATSECASTRRASIVAAGIDGGRRAAETDEVALGCGRALGGGGELAAQRTLVLAERAERRAEHRGALRSGLAARAQRRLDDRSTARVERVERPLEPACRGHE